MRPMNQSLIRRLGLALTLSLAQLSVYSQAPDAVERVRAADINRPDQPTPIAINNADGQGLFEASKEKGAFWRAYRFFEQQETQTFCGVASSVIALNSLAIPGPVAIPALANKKLFTQGSFFTPKTEAIRPVEKVRKTGYPLAQLGDTIRTHGVKVTTVHVVDGFSTKRMRQELCEAIRNENALVIINYFRPYVGQQGGGHFSLIGAYEEKTDRFLIMDVNRINHPSVWIRAQHLYNALNTVDKEVKMNRGYLIVTK